MKKKAKILFFYDTEDFTSSYAADAIIRHAQLLTERGITGQFGVVGLLAKQLKAWGREDVIKALKGHCIGTHSYGHTLHPDICEATDLESFDEAVGAIEGEERQTVEWLKEMFGIDRVLFAVPAGNSKSYAAMYLYAQMGIPFYCDSVIDDHRGTMYSCCNLTHLPYTEAFESLFLSKPRDIGAFLDECAKRETVVLYTHPNMAMYTDFWDKVNYQRENLHPFGEWEEAPRRGEAEREAFFHEIAALLDRIKQDDRFEITSLPELYKTLPARQTLTRGDVPQIHRGLNEKFGPLTLETQTGALDSYSLSELLYACAAFLRGENEFRPTVCHGFLEQPQGVLNSCTVRASDLRNAARTISPEGFLPPFFHVGEEKLGPADFLFAALAVLETDACFAAIEPREQLCDIGHLPDLKQFQLRGTWMHGPGLKDDYLSNRLRLQCWTLR